MIKHSYFILFTLLLTGGCYDGGDVVSRQAELAKERYEYQCWEGGPHIVLPNSVANSWAGNEAGKNPRDPATDYGRACQIDTTYGFISVDDQSAFVIPNPPLAAWDPTSSRSQHFFFVLFEWDSLETDELLDRAKSGASLEPTEHIWNIPDGGVRMIYAGDDPGGTIAGRIDAPSMSGQYRLHSGIYDVPGDGRVLVLRFDLDESNSKNGE